MSKDLLTAAELFDPTNLGATSSSSDATELGLLSSNDLALAEMDLDLFTSTLNSASQNGEITLGLWAADSCGDRLPTELAFADPETDANIPYRPVNFAGHSVADNDLANLIISFGPTYETASSTHERKACFQNCAEKAKLYTNTHGLPSPEFMEKIFNQIYPDQYLFWYSGKLQLPTTKRFFTQAMWSKICDAIREDRPIVEIGPGQSLMLVYAALFGATVVGIESPANNYYYKPPVLNIDGMAPSNSRLGSFQMHHISKDQLIAVTNEEAIKEKEEEATRDSDDDNDSDSEPNIQELFIDRLEEQDGEMPDDQMTALYWGLNIQLSQAVKSLNDRTETRAAENIYTALSNQSAIATVKAVEKLLPGEGLNCAQVFGVMLPPNVFGIGYLINRLQDHGAQITLWGNIRNSIKGCTSILPSPNFYKTSTEGASAIDPQQEITKEEHAFALRASKEKQLGADDLQRMSKIESKELEYGIDGDNLGKIKAIQVKLGLDQTTRKSMRFSPPEPHLLLHSNYSFEPDEFSATYKKTFVKVEGKAKRKASFIANNMLSSSSSSSGRNSNSDNDEEGAAPRKRR